MKISPVLLLLATFTPLSSGTNLGFPSFYFGTGINLNILDDKDESIGYESMLGFQISDSLALEAGYVDFGKENNESKKIDPIFGRVKTIFPVSDYASLNLDIGIAYNDRIHVPLIGIGGGYQLTDSWIFNINYQRLFFSDQDEQDLESIGVSFIYRFGDEVSSQYIDSSAIIEEEFEQEVPIKNINNSSRENKISTPSHSPSSKLKGSVCHEIHITHVIEKGESLTYISKLFDIPFEKIKKSNKSFFVKGRDPNVIYPGELITFPYLDCNGIPQ